MILLLAVGAGLLIGLLRSQIREEAYQIPELKHAWLVLISVLPQLLIFQISFTSVWFPDSFAAGILMISQLLLVIFVSANWQAPGMRILGIGLLLNLLVISFNGGFMPMDPDTARSLFPNAPDEIWVIGERIGRSKNVLLPTEGTRLAILSDRILLPKWFPWARAISIGDLLITAGVFWLLGFNSVPAPASAEISGKTEANK